MHDFDNNIGQKPSYNTSHFYKIIFVSLAKTYPAVYTALQNRYFTKK